MSKAVIPIPCVALKDPTTRLGRPTAWGLAQGGIVYNYQQIKASGSGPWGASGTAVNFVAPPPSPEIIVDRRVMMQMQFYLTFQSTPQEGVPVLQLGTNDGPRAFPIMQSINTINATINNNTITSLMDPIIALMRNNLTPEQRQGDYSQTPCMLDKFQEYDYWNGIPQAAIALASGTAPTAQGAYGGLNLAIKGGSALNPLNAVGENAYTPSRGGFLIQVVQNPLGDGITPKNACVIMTVTEPIFMTPFCQWGEEPGFYGIQTLNISFTLNSNWQNRVWSSNFSKIGSPGYNAVTNTLTNPILLANSPYNPVFSNAGITGAIPFAPQLIFRYITPSPIEVLPPMMEYQYTSIIPYTTQVGASVANGGTGSIYSAAGGQTTTSSAVQFNTIPDQIVIYLARQPQDRNHLTSDTFGCITGVQIQFMNQSGLLATATPFDLYRMSARNGYKGSYDDWRLLSGSVLTIKPGLDLGLEPSLAPGMNGLYNFQITVNWFNASAQPVNFILYVVTLTTGIMTIKDNGTVTQTGIITREDVLSAQQAPSMGYTEAKALVGGDFFSSLKNILSRGADVVSKFGPNAVNILRQIPHPYAQGAATWGDKVLGAVPSVRKFFGFGLRGRGFGGEGQVGESQDDIDGMGQGMDQMGLQSGLQPGAREEMDYEGVREMYPEESYYPQQSYQQAPYHQPERRRPRDPEPELQPRFVRRGTRPVDPRSAQPGQAPQFR